MKTKTSFLLKAIAYGTALAAAPMSAFAAVDVTPITAILPDVAAVGVAIFGVLVAIRSIKLVRRAL